MCSYPKASAPPEPVAPPAPSLAPRIESIYQRTQRGLRNGGRSGQGVGSTIQAGLSQQTTLLGSPNKLVAPDARTVLGRAGRL